VREAQASAGCLTVHVSRRITHFTSPLAAFHRIQLLKRINDADPEKEQPPSPTTALVKQLQEACLAAAAAATQGPEPAIDPSTVPRKPRSKRSTRPRELRGWMAAALRPEGGDEKVPE